MEQREKMTEAQVQVKSLGPPTIPVRMNRRTQLKPLSRLNGDWLPQLKKIKTSEMSGQVRGHNTSEELNTRRVVEQWFGDTTWQLGKLNKAQAGALADLTRLHLERRTLRRNMHLWRQEEARQAERLEREHEIRRAEQERLTAMIEESTRQVRKASRRISRSVHESLFGQFSQAKRRISRVSVSMPSGALLSTVTESSNHLNVPPEPSYEAEPPSSPLPSRTPELPPREASHGDMVKSRVLEVRRGGQPPLVRTRSKSDLGEEKEKEKKEKEEEKKAEEKEEEKKSEEKEEKKAEKEEEEKKAEKEEIPPPTRKKKKERKKALPDALAQISHFNSPRTSQHNLRRVRHGPPSPPFPAIYEDGDFRIDSPSSSSEESSASTCLPLQKSQPPSVPKISVVEENRRRLRQRQKMQERILQEPYVAYQRERGSGLLKPMEHPPPAPKFAEPSNKAEYRRVCLLRNEKLVFEEKKTSLENYTAHLLQEEAKQRAEHLAAQARREEEERLAAERIPSPRALGPADWMRAFVHTGAPVGDDPDDPDNIKFCRYIRKDKESVLDVGTTDSHRKVSSWNHAYSS